MTTADTSAPSGAPTTAAQVPGLEEFSLNSVTLRGTQVDELVDLAVQHGFGGLGLWRDAYAECGVQHAASRVRDAGLQVTSVCRAGMFTDHSPGVSEDNLLALEEAQILGADCLVLVCGGLTAPGMPTTLRVGDIEAGRDRIRDGIAALLPAAKAAGVRVAIEPMHPMMNTDRSVLATLREANDIIEDLAGNAGSDMLGITLDSYHVWWDQQYPQEVDRAAGRIFSAQVSDWVTPIQHQLESRGLPGHGCIDLTEFIDLAHEASFDGLFEIEVLSSSLWAQPAATAAQAAVTSLAPLARHLTSHWTNRRNIRTSSTRIEERTS